MKLFLLRLFTWWNGATLNTLWHTRRHGELVGEDEAGNLYYRTRGGKKDPALGFERRWVIYNGAQRGLGDAAGLERLAAPHRRRGAERRRLQGQALGEAAYGQPDRHQGGDSAQGFDDRARPAPGVGGRLSGLAPGGLSNRLRFARLCRQMSPMRLSARLTMQRPGPRR